jgi:acyl-CoA synthetase (AMP-forming)/AMP-acid ligase II
MPAETLVELLHQRASRRPRDIAYRFIHESGNSDYTISYQELDVRARNIGKALQQNGLQGERVILVASTDPEFVTSFFGTLYAGAIAVPLSPRLILRAASGLEATLHDTEAKMIVAPSAAISRLTRSSTLKKSRVRIVATEELGTAGSAGDGDIEQSSGPGSLALLQYTSGSTEAPRGVRITHDNLLHNASLAAKVMGLSDETIGVSWLPLFHDMGLMAGMIGPLFSGFPCTLLPPANFVTKPITWLRMISRYGATHSGGPNFAYDMCIESIDEEQAAELNLGTWRLAFNGSEMVRPDTLERFSDRFGKCGFRHEAFFPCFGLAEATLIVTGKKEGAPRVIGLGRDELQLRNKVVAAPSGVEGKLRIVSCGGAVDGENVLIVDPDSCQECEEGQIGEVWVRGRSVAGGYWNKGDETARVFGGHLKGRSQERFLRTGDLGFIDQGGLFFVGRLKDIILIRGVNHYPEDIERSVGECHDSLRLGACAAFSVDNEEQECLVVVQEVKRS